MKKDPFSVSLPDGVVIGITPMKPVRLSLVCEPCSAMLEPRAQVPNISAGSLLSISGSSVPEMHIMHACPKCNRQVTTPHAYPLVTMLSEEEYDHATGASVEVAIPENEVEEE